MYMTNKPNGEPFYPVTVAEAVLVSEGETLAAHRDVHTPERGEHGRDREDNRGA